MQRLVVKTLVTSNLAWCRIEVYENGELISDTKIYTADVIAGRNKLLEHLSETADEVTAEPIPDLSVHPNFQRPKGTE